MVKILILFALVPMLSFAEKVEIETKGGGGGIGIACYKGDELTSVELLDLYEARVKGLVLIKDLSGNFEEDVAKISRKIYKHTKEAKKVLSVVTRYSPIPADSELLLTNDAFPVFIPRGCKLKQVANYYNDSLIYIDKTLFDKMNYENQVALAFHEYIYANERNLKVPDSRYSRTIVGLAFSTQDPFELIPTTKTFFCSSADGKVSFNATQVKTENNFWKFSFITLNGHRMFSPKESLVAINGLSPLGDFSAYTMNRPDSEGHTDPSDLKSKINGNERLVVYSDSKMITVTWVGTDPGDSIREVKVDCQKK